MSETIRQKLDRLAEYRMQHDILVLERQDLVDQVITPDLKAKLAEIDVEFAARAEAVNANIAELEAEIKAGVLALGASVKGAPTCKPCGASRGSPTTPRRWTGTRRCIPKCSPSAKKARHLYPSVSLDSMPPVPRVTSL